MKVELNICVTVYGNICLSSSYFIGWKGSTCFHDVSTNNAEESLKFIAASRGDFSTTSAHA